MSRQDILIREEDIISINNAYGFCCPNKLELTARDWKLIDREEKSKCKNKKLPKKYIINNGATVLIWENGEKTIVKRCAEDEFNKRLGFLTAFFQHYSGMSKSKANKFLAELEVEEIKEAKEPKHMKKEKNNG